MSKDKPPSGNNKKSWWKLLKTTFSKDPQDLPALIEVLRDSEARNILDPDVLMMLEGALHVTEMQVRDIMVPRVQMTVIRHSAEPESIMKTIIESGHSRFPVVSDDHVEALLRKLRQTVSSGRGNGYFVTLLPKECLAGQQTVLVVINQKNTGRSSFHQCLRMFQGRLKNKNRKA